MDITFACEKCDQHIVIDEAGAGQQFQCPTCGAPLFVPSANAQAEVEPVPAPVATEAAAPTNSILTAEDRSATTWKCPTCAEEIQKDAQKCRFCGMILTKAAKMGYPAFYENVAKRGLSSFWLTCDYADYLYPDEGGIDNCCLSASSPLLSLFDNQEDEKQKVLKLAGGIVKAMKERLSDIPADSQEALTLRATSKYLWMVRDFARPGIGPMNNPGSLQQYISFFKELRLTLSPIEPEGRRELEEQIDDAIRTCQDQLGTMGMNRSTPSSPTPTQSSEAKRSEKRSTDDQPPPVFASSTASHNTLPPPAPAKPCCYDCKHRLPRTVCGNRESQFCGETVEPKHVCPNFLANPAQGYYNAAITEIATGDDSPETTKSLMEAAIQGGLPQDDEVLARRFLAPAYLDLAFNRTPEDSTSSVVSDPLFLEALKQLEYAVKVDSEQGYGVFSDPLHMATLFRLDACYAMQSNLLKKTRGPDATIAYLEDKLAVFEGVPGEPMVRILLDLGVLFYERGDVQKAKTYFQRVVEAKPIATDKGEEEYLEEAKNKAQENLDILSDGKIGTTGRTRSESSSTVPPSLKSKDTPSGRAPSNQEVSAIFDAISEGDVVVVQSLLNSMPELVKTRMKPGKWIGERDKKDGDKWDPTPLHWATFYALAPVVELLLAKGAEVNSTDIFGQTPIYYLWGYAGGIDPNGLNGDYRVAELLIAHGADLNAKDKSGMSPLHMAVTYPDRWKTVDLLLARGANARGRDKEGITPLHTAVLACNYGQPEELKRIVSSLIAAGADVNAGTKGVATDTPLNWAMKRAEEVTDKTSDEYIGAMAIVEYLKSHGATDTETTASYAQEQRALIKKLVVNVLFLIPYIIVFGAAAGGNPGAAMLMIIPILIWGFIGFRAVLNAFTSSSGFVLFANLKSWGLMFFIGSVICSMFGALIIPILIVIQSIQLYRIRGTNRTIGRLAIAIPVLSIAALIIILMVLSATHERSSRSKPSTNSRGEVGVKTIPSYSLLERLQPQGSVSDYAGILGAGDRAELDAQLSQLRTKTGDQCTVVVLKSLEGEQIDDFTHKLFQKWDVGEKGKNNGVMLLVAIQDRKAHIEVGSGLEQFLPDTLAGRVLNEQLVPAFKQQQYAQGLSLAVNRMCEALQRGEPANKVGGTGVSPLDRPQLVGQMPMTTDLIAFVSNRDKNRQIYTMNSDGTGLRNLSHNPANDWAPAWSPDGERILFCSQRDKWGEYFVMDRDGGNVRKVVDRSELDPAQPPCWAPNGKSILIDSGFSSEEAVRRNAGLYLYDVEKATRSKVQDPPEIANLTHYIHLAWSPDGAKIAFRTYNSRPDNREGRTRIWTMNPNGTGAVPLTDELFIKDGPWWMADGRSLVFTIHEGYEGHKWKGQICVLYVADKSIVKVEGWAPVSEVKPAPDANSGWVAFADSQFIYITRWDGRTWSTPHTIDHAKHPTWSPDGASIAFESSGDGKAPQIWVANADGTGRRKLTPTPGGESSPDAPIQFHPPSVNSEPNWSSLSKEPLLSSATSVLTTRGPVAEPPRRRKMPTRGTDAP